MSDAVVLKILINKQRIKLFEPEFDFTKSLGEHAVVNLSGLLNLQDVAGTLTIVPEMEIEIYKNNAELPFFCGLITFVDIKVETANTDPIERLTLKAMSYSCLFDRDRKNRSFQNTSESYEAAVNLVVGTYSNSGVVMAPEALGKMLGSLTVQYQETDWEFFKRIASRISLPVISSHKTTGPKFYFGTVWSSTKHTITEDEAEYIKVISQAYDKGQQAYQAFSWTTVNTEMEILDIGDIIKYNGTDFYIKEIEIQVLGYEIQQTYLFGAKEIFSLSEIRNADITGLSLPGTVTKVSGNQLQVGLDIDVLSSNNCWYSYATFYSLFYCMPENGDRVYLYFPEAQEAAAFVLNSVRVNSQSGSGAGGVVESLTDEMEAGVPSVSTTEAAGLQQNEQVVDITSLIDALAAPEDGTMVDFAVRFTDGSTSSLQELLGQNANGTNGAAGAGSGAKSATAGQNYDFESLANNEKIKVLATSDGKKIVLDDDSGSILIYLNDDTMIQLTGTDINIVSQDAITFWSDGSINLNAKESIELAAEESVTMACGSSQIILRTVRTILNSPDIYIGE